MAVAAPTQPFEHLVLDFLAYLEFERGLSRNTLEAYRTDLLQFGRFLETRDAGPLEATGADVADFLAGLTRWPSATATWLTSSPTWRPAATTARRCRRPRSSARSRACAPSTATCAGRT